MVVNLLWLAALGPLVLIAAGVAPEALAGRSSGTRLGLARAAAVAALVISLLTLTAVFAYGPMRTELIGREGIGLGLYLDSLSAMMFVLVSFIGLIVVNYSRNYLDGDPGQSPVLAVALPGARRCLDADHFRQSVPVRAGLDRHQPQPAQAAGFLWRTAQLPFSRRARSSCSRLGDLCLDRCDGAVYTALSATLDYAAIFPAAQAMRLSGSTPEAVQAAALLLVIAALLKSAQFPCMAG